MVHALRVALVGSLLVTGCGQMTSGGRKTLVVGGLVVATAGVFVAQPTAVDSDNNGRNDWALNDDYSSFVPGALMVGAGLAMLVAGLGASEVDERSPSAPAIARSGPRFTVTAAPTAPAPALTTAPAATPLPELPVDEPTLRTGKQIRAAVTFGQCEHAWVMWRGLRGSQPAYADALVDGPVMSPCVRK